MGEEVAIHRLMAHVPVTRDLEVGLVVLLEAAEIVFVPLHSLLGQDHDQGTGTGTEIGQGIETGTETEDLIHHSHRHRGLSHSNRDDAHLRWHH